MKKVLITGAGGPAAIAVYKSLKFYDVEIFMADMCSDAPGLFLVEKTHRVNVPKATDEVFTNKVLKTCLEHKIDLLIPTVDDELLPLANCKSQYAEHGIKIATSSATSLKLCRDKLSLMEICDGEIPLSRYAKKTKALESFGWHFPLIIKPRKGSGSRGIHKVNSHEEYQKLDCGEDYLVQEYLPGTEYSVDIYLNQEGSCLACVPRTRVKVDSGVAIVSKTVNDEYLYSLAKKVANKLGLTGVANIQFKEDANGIPKLLEVNPRFSGTMPLTVASGADMPMMLLKESIDKLSDNYVQHSELGVVRYLEEKFIPVEQLEKVH